MPWRLNSSFQVIMLGLLIIILRGLYNDVVEPPSSVRLGLTTFLGGPPDGNLMRIVET